MLDNAILRDINSKNVDACWIAESGGAFNGDHQVSPRQAYGALRPPFIYTNVSTAGQRMNASIKRCLEHRVTPTRRLKNGGRITIGRRPHSALGSLTPMEFLK